MESGSRGKSRRKNSDSISFNSILSDHTNECLSTNSIDAQKPNISKSLDGRLSTTNLSRSQIRSEIATVLISHNLEFLECIMDSALGKEGGSVLVKSILDFLFCYHSRDEVEVFIRRVVRKKIDRRKKNTSESTMKTFLRDNSWEILLLSAFLHAESKSYLINVLQGPVTGALALFEKFELSPSNPSLGGQRPPVQLLVEKILHSILAKKDSIPLPLIRMCTVLKMELDSFFHIAPPSPSTPSSAILVSPISDAFSNLEHTASPDASLSFEISELLPASIDEFVNSTSPPELKPNPLKRSRKRKPQGHLLHKFSISEQMISTFLFLRLFVPVLTLPEKHGLLKPEEVTKLSSKYLLLTGKELITLCNDTEGDPGAAEFQKSNKKKIKRILTLFTTEKLSAYDRLGAELNLELEKESLLLDKAINQYMLNGNGEEATESSLANSKYRQTVHGYDSCPKAIHKSLPLLHSLRAPPSDDRLNHSQGFKKFAESSDKLDSVNVAHPDDQLISTLTTFYPKIYEALEKNSQLPILQRKEYRSLFLGLKSLLEAFQAAPVSNEQGDSEKYPSIIKKVGKWMRFTSFSVSSKELRKSQKAQCTTSNGEAQV